MQRVADDINKYFVKLLSRDGLGYPIFSSKKGVEGIKVAHSSNAIVKQYAELSPI